MIILSKQNPLVKELASLKEKKGRRAWGSFLVEGAKMVREAAESGMHVLRVVVREGYAGETFLPPAAVLGSDAFAAVSDEKTPQGILAGLQDSSNVGAVLRTAVAAGYEEVYLAGCADPFSPKSVRASMSGVFFARIMQGTRQEILSALNVPLIAADMDGEDVFAFRPPEVFCLAVGNEGNGLSEEVRGAAAYTVRIPMDTRTESLNAAVSAGILMYALKAGRKF